MSTPRSEFTEMPLPLLDIYKHLRRHVQQMAQNAELEIGYNMNLVDCGYIGAAAELIKSQLTEDEQDLALQFERDFSNFRILAAIDAHQTRP